LVEQRGEFLPRVLFRRRSRCGRIVGHEFEGAVFLAQAAAPLLKRTAARSINLRMWAAAGVRGTFTLRFESGRDHADAMPGQELLRKCELNAMRRHDYDAGESAGMEQEFIKRRRAEVGKPSDVAETVVFLVRSELITAR